MSNEEREILLTVQKEAMRVLSAANAEAERVASDAERDAVELVLEQQESAQSLLQRAHETATERAHSAEDTSALLESHRTAAELLAATEQEVAAKLSKATANAAVDVLMAGHREAAAILLESWMRVTEGRPPDGQRSR